MNYNQIQFRHSLIYGAIFGISIVILLLILYIFGMTNNGNIYSLAPLIYIIGAHISVKHHRDRLNDGYITFGKAFGTALLTCIFMGIVWAVYGYFLYKYLLPNLLTEQIALIQEMYLKFGMSDQLVEKLSQAITPFSVAFGYVTNSVIFGSLLSLIIAALLKRIQNPMISSTDNEL